MPPVSCHFSSAVKHKMIFVLFIYLASILLGSQEKISFSLTTELSDTESGDSCIYENLGHSWLPIAICIFSICSVICSMYLEMFPKLFAMCIYDMLTNKLLYIKTEMSLNFPNNYIANAKIIPVFVSSPDRALGFILLLPFTRDHFIVIIIITQDIRRALRRLCRSRQTLVVNYMSTKNADPDGS